MADKNKNKKTRETETDPDCPEGMTELGRSRVVGWFVREQGNKVRGILKSSFTVPGRVNKGRKFPDKKVYQIDITDGETKVMNAEGDQETISEGLVGVDETGYLKKLSDLEQGTEVCLVCKGKEDPADDQSPWVFKIYTDKAPF